MKIAMLIPTRERPNLQLTLISSIITTVSDINNVDIYFGVDEDDKYFNIMEKIVKAIPCVKMIPIQNNGKFIGINRIWNILADNCKEEIFGYAGDDFIWKTPNWDLEILKEFNEENLPKDKIKLVYCYDGHRNGDLCTNAFTHRQYYEVIGYLCRQEFLINYSDSWLYQSFNAFGRLKYRPDITIFHNHWIYNGRPKDATANRMLSDNKDRFSDEMWAKLKPELHNDIKKLGEYLNMTPDWSKVDPI
jgi:rhodanese-related sulfurtransferase